MGRKDKDAVAKKGGKKKKQAPPARRGPDIAAQQERTLRAVLSSNGPAEARRWAEARGCRAVLEIIGYDENGDARDTEIARRARAGVRDERRRVCAPRLADEGCLRHPPEGADASRAERPHARRLALALAPAETSR